MENGTNQKPPCYLEDEETNFTDCTTTYMKLMFTQLLGTSRCRRDQQIQLRTRAHSTTENHFYRQDVRLRKYRGLLHASRYQCTAVHVRMHPLTMLRLHSGRYEGPGGPPPHTPKSRECQALLGSWRRGTFTWNITLTESASLSRVCLGTTGRLKHGWGGHRPPWRY